MSNVYDDWPTDEIVDILEMIRDRIYELEDINNQQKNKLTEIIDSLINEYQA